MKIKEITINNFAGLRGVTLAPSDGVSVVTGRNESGKSRICGFIRFMLYGVQKKDDINRILSFGDSVCAGTLVVSTESGVFRIEREAAFAERGGRLSCTRNRCRITDLSSMTEVETEKTPGELFLGVPLSVYASTAYINQIDGNKTGDGELSEAAANIIFSADENLSAAKAIEKLDEIRIALYHKDRRGGRIAEETAKIDALKAQLISMESQSKEIITLTGTCEELRAKKESSNKRLSDLTAFFSEYERWQIKVTKAKADKALSEAAELKKQAKEIEDDISKDGFFPDADYLSALRSAGATAERAMLAAIEANEAEKSAERAKEQLSDRAAFLEKLNDKGGFSEVRERHEKLKTGRKRSAVLAVAFSAAATVAALLAILGFTGVIPFYKAVSLAFAGVAALSAAAAAWGLVSSRSKAKGLSALASGFGMNRADFDSLLSALEGNEAAVEAIVARAKAATAEREKAEIAYGDALANTRELLSRSCDITDVSDGELLAFASNAISVIEQNHREIDRLNSRAEAKEEAAAGFRDRLIRYSDEEIAAACEEEFDDEALEAINIQEKKREYNFLTNSQSGFTERLHNCENRLSVLLATTTPAADIEHEIEQIKDQLDRDKEAFDAVVTAMDAIRQSEAELKASISPRIAARAGEIMKFLSDRKYDTLSLSESFGLSYLDGGMTRDVSCLSAGTADIAYLALRIALIDTLYSGEKPPLVFDESFTRLDRDRLSALNGLTAKLSEEGTQCILFCCDDRLSGFTGTKIELK